MSAEPETTLAWAEFLWRVTKEAPQTAAFYIALFLYWRQTRRAGRDVTIKVPPATARAVMPTPAILNLSPVHGTSIASLALTTGNDAGTQAMLDSMAEVFPYEFPPN